MTRPEPPPAGPGPAGRAQVPARRPPQLARAALLGASRAAEAAAALYGYCTGQPPGTATTAQNRIMGLAGRARNAARPGR